MNWKFIILLLLTFSRGCFYQACGQLQLSTSSKINTKCNGQGCNYYGPSILINEVMIHPATGDGSIYGQALGASNPQAGEWIELYNPHLCKSVDISCYFLGNNAFDGNSYGGGFELPQGTVVPPRGFCIVRGVNAEPVPAGLLVQNGGNTREVVIQNNQSVCIDGGYRLWFPNAGGWFAFYDRNGVAQDAISWNVTNTETDHPCNPPGNCPFTGQLASYQQIPSNHKNYIFSYEPDLGLSIARQPDGGGWAYDQSFNPTEGSANGIPIPAPVITCNGKAIITASGGSPPYSYAWDDGQSQTNDTAVGLCEGTYCVTVTDDAGLTATACVFVPDFVPAVDLAAFDTICESAAPFLLTQGSPPGGVYSGTGVTGSTFDPAVAGAGTHSLYYTYYTPDSCYSTDSNQITIFPGINMTMPASMEMCIDAPGFQLAGASPSGGFFFGAGVNNGFFSPLAAGAGIDTIRYQITTSAFCTSVAHMIITVHPLPDISLESLTSTCLNTEPFLLTEGMPAGGTYTGTGVTDNIFYPAVAGTGSFPITYAYTDEFGCSSDTSGTIKVSSLPTVHAVANPDVICRGDSANITAFGAQQFTWSPIAISSPSIMVSPYNTAVYEVIGVDANGCEGSDSCRVEVIPLPEVNLPDAIWMMTGEPVEIACHSGPYQYLWSTGSDEELISVGDPGIYWVKVWDSFCVAKDTVEVVEIPAVFVPNAFTPNGDGLNDFFGPVTDDGLGIKFYVYTRWGELIFESENLNKAWDGNYKGGLAPCDVYTWVLEWDYDHLTPHNHIMSLDGKKQGIVVLIR